MAKIVLDDLTNLQNETSAVSTINVNNQRIENALENTLSRDGTTPNQMSASLDMNTNRILNLPLPLQDTEPVRKGEFDQLAEDTVGIAVRAEDAAQLADQSATEAAASAVEAAASALESAVQAEKLRSSSTTSIAIGTGSKVFTVDSNDYFASNMYVFIQSQGNDANYMFGTITDYTTDQLTVNVDVTGGSGTHADWLITIAGARGSTGPTGPTGPMTGPVSSTTNNIAVFADTSGDVLADGGIAVSALLTEAEAAAAYQPLDADLTSWAGVTRAAGFDTFVATPSSANLKTLVSDETGSGALVFATSPTLVTPVLGAATGTSIALTGALDLSNVTTATLTASGADLLIEGTAAKKVGKETIWVSASSMTPRATNGAARGSAEMTTNKNMFVTLDYDTTTQEFAQFEIFFPKSWNLGTVTFQPVWSHASTTVNFGVVWSLAGVARSDDDAGDVAFGTVQTSTDTGGTTNDIYIGPESAAITIAGTPATGDTVQFQLARVPSDGSDTMAIDARLHGIKVFFTTSASTDA